MGDTFPGIGITVTKYVSYTFGSNDFVQAVIERGIREGYPITLNATDFRVFITILQKLALHDSVNHKDIPSIPGYGEDGESEPLGDWAWQFLSSIGETLNVEGV